MTITNLSVREYRRGNPGADPGFQVRGGALKQIAPSRGRHEIFGVFRVKNHDFTPKNHIFFNCRERRENCRGISCEKSRFYAKRNHIFSNFRGARAGCAPPESAPAIKNGQSRETGNTGHTRRRQTKQKHNTICVGHHHVQTNINYVNKTRACSLDV